MCEILTNPASKADRRHPDHGLVPHDGGPVASATTRPQWRPTPPSDDSERGPARWFSAWELGQAIMCDDRSDWRTVEMLLAKLSQGGRMGRLKLRPMLERREVEGTTEYRRAW